MAKKPKTMRERLLASAERKMKNRQVKLDRLDAKYKGERKVLAADLADAKEYLKFIQQR